MTITNEDIDELMAEFGKDWRSVMFFFWSATFVMVSSVILLECTSSSSHECLIGPLERSTVIEGEE